MVTKLVKCPTCKKTISVSGEPGDEISLTCPNCKQKGKFRIPLEQDKTDSQAISIDVQHLTKTYADFTAVNDISFQVQKGEVFGFLGPNGAGKTTTIKSILDLTHADRGMIRINGYDIKAQGKQAKQLIGYMPEKVAFYDNLTALQNLMFYAEIKHVTKEECMHLIIEYGLGEAGKKRVGKFSKGMVQRLGMARAVLGNPPILILDEPTGGLDPRGVVLIRDKILEMKKKGTTIFVSSHILSEVQEVCDRVGIINKGALVAEDSVDGLSKKLNLKPLIMVTVDAVNPKIEEAVRKLPGVDQVTVQKNTLQIVCDGAMKAKVILAITNAGGNIQNLQTKEPSLEEVFMRYTEG
jgi:ABC-type multidrug transport system ATPase subunit